MSFHDSALESSPNCFKDSLTLGVHRVCGPLEGTVVLSIKNVLNILFTTDNETNNKGFNMTIRQKRCPNSHPVIEPLRKNEKLDFVDFKPHLQLGNAGLILKESYPKVHRPYSPFPLPTGWEEEHSSEAYLPPNKGRNHNIPLREEPPNEVPFRHYLPTLSQDCILQLNSENNQNMKPLPIAYLPPVEFVGDIPILGKQNPVANPNLQYNEDQFRLKYEPLPPTFIVPEPSQNLPPENVRPINTQQAPFNPTFSSPNGGFSFSPSKMFPSIPSLQQCCGQIYSDSHFLIVSPSFPQSQSSNCIYTLSRFSPTTTQVRLQFTYFLVGEESSEGCSGGFLEIDGTRICGCKTGLLWISMFFDSEPAKILHLKIEPSINKLINGFIIEVFQDDSYLQRDKRNTGSDKEGQLVNVNQYVETIVERNPVSSSWENYPIPSHSIWGPSSQSSRLKTYTACLQWSIQNWLEFLKTPFWSKYQCSSNNDVILSTVCKSCQYFCRQNCKCCQY